MDKKSYIQISITILILLIITFVYFDYFKNPRENLSKKTEDSSAKKLVKNSDDLISEMSYFSEDNKGNRYEIFSKYGILNPDKSNMILPLTSTHINEFVSYMVNSIVFRIWLMHIIIWESF